MFFVTSEFFDSRDSYALFKSINEVLFKRLSILLTNC